MTTVSIQQFRATLASRSDQGRLVHSYREITRRPEVAVGMVGVEWAAWPAVATPVAST